MTSKVQLFEGILQISSLRSMAVLVWMCDQRTIMFTLFYYFVRLGYHVLEISDYLFINFVGNFELKKTHLNK